MGKPWLVCLLLACCCGLAVAQTGGTMGGGDWSSSSSGGGGGFSDTSGGYSSSYDSGGGSWSSGSSSSGSGELSIPFVIFMFIVIVIWLIYSVAKRHRDFYSFSDDAPMLETVDVSVLRIAIDARARKFLQGELKRIAQIADTATADGRVTMLREVAVLLRKLRDAWVYGGAVNEAIHDLGTAKQLFDRHVDDARSRFREETVRNEQGTVTRAAASEYRPRADEGQGLLLVSLVIAARRELFTVTRIGNGDDLRAALEAASQLAPTALVAIEVIWQPSEDEDRLSSLELEARYPRPDVIPIQGALVGKMFCDHCGGPFPAELVSCPHCGAPAPGREKRAA